MNKPKKGMKAIPEIRQERDFFQTPNYATDLIVPYLPQGRIWECAAGNGKIVDRLKYHGRECFQSDIESGVNFLADKPLFDFDIIVTNPPFSLKRQFTERCLSLGAPFALLIPVDFCGWILESMAGHDLKWVVPTRRINFITPTGRSGKTSSAQFHSGWLTFGFSVPKQFEIVELSRKEMENV